MSGRTLARRWSASLSSNVHGGTAAANRVFFNRRRPPCRAAPGTRWPLAAERVVRWADERMDTWLVEVIGERFDTEELVRAFGKGDIHAVEKDGEIFLTGPALEALTDASAVRDAAERALNDFAAVLKLDIRNFRKPSLGTAVIQEAADGSRRVHRILVAEPGEIRVKGHAAVVFVGGAAPPAPSQSREQKRLSAINRNPRLRNALQLWSAANASWPQLYRALEEVEIQLGVPVDSANLCSANERKRFSHTANTKSAGADARHAHGKFHAPTNPMSLGEAKRFMRRVIEAAIERYI